MVRIRIANELLYSFNKHATYGIVRTGKLAHCQCICLKISTLKPNLFPSNFRTFLYSKGSFKNVTLSEIKDSFKEINSKLVSGIILKNLLPARMICTEQKKKPFVYLNVDIQCILKGVIV